MGLPTAAERRAIVAACAGGAAADGVADAVARQTVGCTGADVVGTYRRGALCALERIETRDRLIITSSTENTSSNVEAAIVTLADFEGQRA
jgi:hypothetical protein